MFITNKKSNFFFHNNKPTDYDSVFFLMVTYKKTNKKCNFLKSKYNFTKKNYIVHCKVAKNVNYKFVLLS